MIKISKFSISKIDIQDFKMQNHSTSFDSRIVIWHITVTVISIVLKLL